MNVPQLRFSGFEDTWSKKKIKEIAIVTSGLTPLRSRNEFFKNGTIPWVKTMDLNNSIIKDTQEYVTDVAMKETSLRLLPANTLLIAMYGGFNQIGRTGLINFSGTTNQAISALTSKENSFNPFFLQSYLNFNVEKWKRLAASSRKDPNITKSDIENFFVRLPSISEQDEIASFFKLIKEKIEKQEEKIEKLEQFKKGMMQKIFSQELRFRDDDGGEFAEWEPTTLGKLITTFSGGTPLSNNPKYYNGEIPFIRSGEIHNDKTELFITEDGHRNSSAKIVEKGDLLLALYGATSGEIAISKINGAINQAILCIRTEQYLPFILYYWEYKKENILKTYLQGGQGNISASIVKSIDISLPIKEEQMKIGDYFANIDEKIKKEKEKLLVLEEQKRGFMRGMFV